MAHDILGLGGPDSTVKNLETPNTSMAPSEQEKRRRRMNEGADEVTPSPSGLPSGDAVSGIDIGPDIERENPPR